MAQKNTELLTVIYQIADERGLEISKVLEQVKKAYLTAFKKMNGNDEFEDINEEEKNSSFSVDIDEETGEIFVLADKKVVSVMTDQNTQILESQAKLIDSRLREGDHIQIDVTPDDFGRIAAQAAYQRLMQGLRDAELETITEKYQDKVGKIITAVIQRKDANFVRLEVDRAEAIMPTSESIPGEFYKSADRKRFLLVRLHNTLTDKRMVLSRGSGEFLKALFELEVPEISTGNVEIVEVAREAGSRSKIAVRSVHDKVDAIGACVGPRGTRIDSIMNEINPEKVDIILHDNDTKTFVMNALSPAKVLNIKINDEDKTAIVLVDEEMLSLAIGKDGQNARLAAKLTGYKIDITGDKALFDSGSINSEVADDAENSIEENITENTDNNSNEFSIDNLEITDRQKKLLTQAGISSIEEIKSIISGDKEIEGFTKRDISKLEQII